MLVAQRDIHAEWRIRASRYGIAGDIEYTNETFQAFRVCLRYLMEVLARRKGEVGAVNGEVESSLFSLVPRAGVSDVILVHLRTPAQGSIDLTDTWSVACYAYLSVWLTDQDRR